MLLVPKEQRTIRIKESLAGCLKGSVIVKSKCTSYRFLNLLFISLLFLFRKRHFETLEPWSALHFLQVIRYNIQMSIGAVNQLRQAII